MKVPAKAKVRIVPMCLKKLPCGLSVNISSRERFHGLPGAIHSQRTE
jgi:hypothetical protein